MQIGDDLTKARRFVDTVLAGLARMNARQEAAPILLAIRGDAQTMHARGIARSAECALTVLSGTHTREQIDGYIYSLTRLVDQYKQGLEEIAPDQAQVIETDTRSDHERANEILAPLIRFAPALEQRDALKFLAGFECELPAASTSEYVDGVHLETMMPSVTDQILSDARHAGKSVSVSYAVGDIVASEELVSDIQAFLMELGTCLVMDALASPKSRQAAGLSANGLINIMAQEEYGTLALHIECSGQSHGKAPVNLSGLSPLIARSGIFSIEQAGDTTIARLVNVDMSSDTPVHLIEPGTLLQEAII